MHFKKGALSLLLVLAMLTLLFPERMSDICFSYPDRPYNRNFPDRSARASHPDTG